ncbi:uncharacterized protein LOC124676353 [Lolium rigidum]|uniref:uncharacterized protein LOC124676353 n=1 Tax=Lolium rigidum TaxID=89674 RepID=UPI001F5C553F|nr:uncharacterized protein LOC124676353 [Lolium rigidum]
MAARLLGGARRAALLPNVRRRATNSWAAVRDTFFSTKEVFENHRVVFTVGTSIASVLTAWAGYSFRHMQQSKIDKRLHSIEQSLRDTHRNDHDEIKKIVTSNNISTPACIATALTTSVVGYALGWRGGAWYARRAFRREQQKLMGQIKLHNRWHWRPFSKLKSRLRSRHASKSSDAPQLPGNSAEAPSISGASVKGQGAEASLSSVPPASVSSSSQAAAG